MLSRATLLCPPFLSQYFQVWLASTLTKSNDDLIHCEVEYVANLHLPPWKGNMIVSPNRLYLITFGRLILRGSISVLRWCEGNISIDCNDKKILMANDLHLQLLRSHVVQLYCLLGGQFNANEISKNTC